MQIMSLAYFTKKHLLIEKSMFSATIVLWVLQAVWENLDLRKFLNRKSFTSGYEKCMLGNKTLIIQELKEIIPSQMKQ